MYCRGTGSRKALPRLQVMLQYMVPEDASVKHSMSPLTGGSGFIQN